MVGVLEELEMTFEVLSHYIPKFFRGVSKFYASIREESRTVNKNIFRPKVNKAIQDLVNEKQFKISKDLKWVNLEVSTDRLKNYRFLFDSQ